MRPLTLGTAGHIDHGKTALVAALTGVDTDRLPEERARGMTIDLGFAPLRLPSGRRLSVVDVPGHERFVRTMVAGATGVDLFLLVIAADDGVMPQTREHVAVLRALGVEHGVVAVTKSDAADPELALLEAAELLPDAPAVAVSARTGTGLDELRAALDGAAATTASRADGEGPARLHVDRVFTIRGAGTVVTGTLWEGTIGRGDELVLLPRQERVRVRAVQVHDEPLDRAEAGQRVAVNLVGIEVRHIERGDVLAAPEAHLEPSYVLDAQLDVRIPTGTRVHVHHGTRETPARVAALGGRFHQLRLGRPLAAQRNDRIVIRSIAPPDTLGGGTILDAKAKKHGPTREAIARLSTLASGAGGPSRSDVTSRGEEAGKGEAPPPTREREKGPPAPPRRPALEPEDLELEQRLKEAAHEPPLDSDLDKDSLARLRAHQRATRVGRTLHFHPDALRDVQTRVEQVVERDGEITLAQLRDELQTSRKYAQAILEHLDATKVTLRRPDDSRILRRRRA